MNLNSPSSPEELFHNFVQIGVVVADIDRVSRNLQEIFGIGPFRTIYWPPEGRENMERFYYGKPASFTARMAFSELGPIELELIQPLDNKSIWAEFLSERGEGIHHIRFNVNAVEPVIDYLAQHHIEPAQQGSGIRPGTEWVNFATEDKVGFIVEIMNVVVGTDGRTPNIVDGKVKI